ncbi:hypothetical protein MRX96_049665 [Rhipicephalus microplus]
MCLDTRSLRVCRLDHTSIPPGQVVNQVRVSLARSVGRGLAVAELSWEALWAHTLTSHHRGRRPGMVLEKLRQGAHMSTSLVSGKRNDARQPTSSTAAVVTMGTERLMLMKWPKVKLPRRAANRLAALRKPYAVLLQIGRRIRLH